MLKKNFGNSIKDQLRAASKDRLYRFLLDDGKVKGAVIYALRMVNEIKVNFDLGIPETLILGHAYLGAGLMASTLKGEDSIALKIDCGGPVKGLSVEANALGEVRGFLKQNPIPVGSAFDAISLSPLFGAGFLSVIKTLEDAKHPFTGKVVLEYGSIAKDLANYYLTSEQIPTAFNLSIHFDKKGEVAGAGGLFLQAMPGADENRIETIEKAVLGVTSLGKEFSLGETPEALVKTLFKQFSPVILDSQRVEFFCRCSEKRMLDYLGMMPRKDLEEILENGPFPLETRCHNCNSAYCFSEADIRKKYEARK